ncbi:MAG: hypothetical protein HY960_00330 [Ignavibacteriae bacterium]|nr:hypothetical protein [Ignavibacteriota bacterium]
MRIFPFVLLSLLFFLSCENEQVPVQTFLNNQETPTQESLIRATTNKSSYGLNEVVAITIYNGSDSILTFSTCSQVISRYIQKKFGSEWKDITGRGLPCTGFNPYGKIVLYPRQSYRYTDGYVHFGYYRSRFPFTFGSKPGTSWLYTNEIYVDGN